MPINKNAYIRYIALDKCFSNSGRKFFIEDLLEICNRALYESGESYEGIKRRQLFNDIKFMKSEDGFVAPIIAVYENKKPFYRYEYKNYSINQRPMNTEEAEIMRAALVALTRFKGLPQFEWINEIIPKIESGFQLASNKDFIISFQSSEYLKGLNYLAELYTKIINKSVIEILYQPFNKSGEKYIVHPYFLKQYNTRWFLLGYNEQYDSISIYALDRIVTINESEKTYRINIIDFEEYFEDLIGVSIPINSVAETIVLKFSPDLSPYIISNPIHGSQKKIFKDDNGLTISLTVITNYELKKLILSFGSDCIVIQPISLINEIKEIIENSAKNYF